VPSLWPGLGLLVPSSSSLCPCVTSACLTALSSSLPPVWKEHRCSSSDDDTDVDVEGLRRRRGREPSSSQPVVPVDVEDQAKGEGIGGELGISLNMCFLGALVLLGLGILLFSGEYHWLGLQSDFGPALLPCPHLTLSASLRPHQTVFIFRYTAGARDW
jgi:hypothetical protein